MKQRLILILAGLSAGLLLTWATAPATRGQEAKASRNRPASAATRTALAWTLDEARAELALYPRDTYLQYVTFQLARREGRLDELVNDLRLPGDDTVGGQPASRQRDLFNLFSGALVVQESLQLDALRGERPRARPEPGAAAPGPPQEERRRRETVKVADLAGPAVKSHPWQKLLAGRKPDIFPLARCVPEDFYFAEFRSVGKLLEAAAASDLWGGQLSSQAVRDARRQPVLERLARQLVLPVEPALYPFYEEAVEGIAVTGSDPFLGEGSDVTLLLRLKRPDRFRERLDGALADAGKVGPGLRQSRGELLGVPYVALTSADRTVSVYSAYPEPGLHVRGNSKVAFRRVLEAIKGRTEGGEAVRRLGDTAEFGYLRTLLPSGAGQEDGFLYLSDPFIRHLVGPRLKLTERRRRLCYNHLRMIGHAALLYRTDRGWPPASLQELADAGCCPGRFGEGNLTCPDGGRYALSADGMAGVCSHHGHAHALTPCCEVPVAEVNGLEADEYRQFVKEYNEYWKTYFDPIALRVQITPERYRLETVVLPLIDNSVYTGLARVLGGKPEPLDALPVPRRNILSIAFRFNKDEVLKEVRGQEKKAKAEVSRAAKGLDKALDELDVIDFLSRGVGNQVGLHVYDAAPMFGFNLPGFFGLLASESGVRGDPAAAQTALLAGFLGASLNSPVYLSVPVQDAAVVDRFLDRLDRVAALGSRQAQREGPVGFFGIDYYHLEGGREKGTRGWALCVGPLRWRVFGARIGNGLYLATQREILDDLRALAAGKAPVGDGGPAAHALVRLRPHNWDRVLADYRLGWAENNRMACQNNLGPLAAVSRAFATVPPGRPARRAEGRDREVLGRAEELLGARFFCPEGGHYDFSEDGKECTCSRHESVLAPRQREAPDGGGQPDESRQAFGGLTATLTFREDGLHAVLIVDRK
jgi:hypothetical protein